jgi:hypothetical protein
VIIENFFGRLKNKFEIMDRRWAQLESFETCCALVNFDTRPRGGSPMRAADGVFYLRCFALGLGEGMEREGQERRPRSPPGRPSQVGASGGGPAAGGRW